LLRVFHAGRSGAAARLLGVGRNRAVAPRAAFAENEKPAETAGLRRTSPNLKNSGAGEGIRTLDPDLGKVVLYH
jgi:hypothetical protein